jgi:Ca2+-binding EF-hand superfamily protein
VRRKSLGEQPDQGGRVSDFLRKPQVKEMMSASADDDGKIYYQDFAELLAEN